jgi:hypothetical protein
VGQGRNPECPEPPDWQVDALAADLKVALQYAAKAYRLCGVRP